MKITRVLFKVKGQVLCQECALDRAEDATPLRQIQPNRDTEPLVCERCGAELRIICPHCGNFHIDPRGDIEAQAQWCAEQDRISIEAERIEFFDKWL